MPRTAPAPDIPPIPGMCPSIAVLAGGGDGGGGSGDGAGSGGGDDNAGTGTGGEDAADDSRDANRGAPDYEKYPECGYASHPVDVVTGRAFTHPIVDLELPGPLPFTFARMYSSKMADRDVGLGFGWGHTLGWVVEVRRRRITVWNEQGIGVDFPPIPVGGEAIGPWGWVLRRDSWGFAVDADDGLWHVFSAPEGGGSLFRLTAIEDRNRNRVSITYEDGHLLEVKDSAGRILRFGATKDGHIASIQARIGSSEGSWITCATYAYDERGNLASAMDADGFTSRYAYDDDHRLVADTDRTGLTFHFVYGAEGRCVEAWGEYPGKRDPSLVELLPKYLADGTTRAKGIHHCKFEYAPDGYSEVIDSTQARRFFGTKHGTIAKAVDGGGVMTAAYREDGHLLARTDAMGATTRFKRDARGRILEVTDPLGGVTTTERDAAGLPVRILDAAGGITFLERDARGNVLLETDALGGIRSYRYDERGLLLEAIDPRGGKKTWTYDEQGNVNASSEADGAVFHYEHDALGRLIAETDPAGATTRYTYSTRGDLVSRADALGGVTRYTYDGERHVTQIIDGAGGLTAMVWGGYHALAARRDASGREVALGYNREGELVEVRNERGERHSLEYSTSGQLIGETTFDGRRLRYKNDLAGRPLIVVDGLGQEVKLAYDLAGQLVERELPDGSVETFTYDPLGRIIAAKSPACEVRLERDRLGQVVREVQIVGGEEHSVEVVYDPNGDCAGRRTSLGLVEAIERDARGLRRRTILGADAVVEHAHDALGREIVRALPRGGRIESSYDALGRLQQIRARASAARAVRRPDEPEWLGAEDDGIEAATAYGYDAGGELVDAWDKRRGHTSYTYDPVGRLVSASVEGGSSEAFHYDPAGNLHEAGPGAPIRDYGAGNRLERKGETSFRWDAAGRLVEKRVQRDGGAEEISLYRWNGSSLLQSVSLPDGTLVEFTYDAFARRVQKRVSKRLQIGGPTKPVALTRFVWDGDVLAHEIRRTARSTGSAIVEERTYWFEDDDFAPVAHKATVLDGAPGGAGEWYHYLTDPVGTPERLVSGDGKPACDLLRSAWGLVTVTGKAVTETAIRFPGQYADDETGLFYNRFRYYDPDETRFISADPLGLDAGIHAFLYAPNPLLWSDPYGEIKVGGSGKPRQHFVKHKSRKCALEAAGPDAEHHQRHRARVPKGQRPHFHPAGAHDDGEENVHHMYGKGKNKLRPGEKRRRRR